MTSDELRVRARVDGRGYARRCGSAPPTDKVIRNHFLLTLDTQGQKREDHDFEIYKRAFLEGQKDIDRHTTQVERFQQLAKRAGNA